MLVSVMFLTAGVNIPITAASLTITVSNEAELVSALTNPADGDYIQLSADIVLTAPLEFTVEEDEVILIDGANHTITGRDVTDANSAGLMLKGNGNIVLHNITLIGGEVTANGASYGLLVSEGVSVLTANETGAICKGGTVVSGNSYGILALSSGNIKISSATGGEASRSYGAYNVSSGIIELENATGGSTDINDAESFGVINTSSGTITVGTATGGDLTGTASDDAIAVDVVNGGTVNCEEVIGAELLEVTGTINSGSNTKRLLLQKDANQENCILDYIVISKAGSTDIGRAPIIYSGGIEASWYEDLDKTIVYNNAAVTSDTVLYSPLYKEFHITFNGNGDAGGSVPLDTESYNIGDVITLPGNTENLTRPGYTFGGWSLTEGGLAIETYTIEDADDTFYAVWNEEIDDTTEDSSTEDGSTEDSSTEGGSTEGSSTEYLIYKTSGS